MEFKQVKGYPNYEVSNTGVVRNVTTGKTLTHIINSCGYHQVHLGYRKDPTTGEYIYKDGNKVQYLAMVARLVAEAFIPNPNNFPEVNHISEDKNDNTVENLEWVDRKTNMNHGTRNVRQGNYAKNMPQSHREKLSIAAKNRGAHLNNGKKVIVEITEPDGNKIEFKSVREAARYLGVNPSRVHYNAKSGGDIDGYTVLKKI